MEMPLAPGLVSSVRIVVGDADTAVAVGSGDVPVLGTPPLLALAEAAAVAAVGPSLESGLTSVGTSPVVEHRRPSPVGAEVVVEAELTEVAGRRLAFRFTARHKPPSCSPDGSGAAVGAGTLERVVVDRTGSSAKLSKSEQRQCIAPRPVAGRARCGRGPGMMGW
jgi:fluoroacetyl-CoA thioesterase